MRRTACTIGAAVVLALLLSGCGGPGTPTTEPTPSATPTPEPTEEPVSQDIALPTSCEQAFSTDFVHMMEAAYYPLNYPGITMPPTELVAGQSALATVPALHCTWGAPSDTGISTAIALIGPAQADAIRAEALAAGFTCGPRSDVEHHCLLEEVDDTSEMGPVRWGEQHVFRGNAWIVSGWLNVDMFGYHNHIVSQLWP